MRQNYPYAITKPLRRSYDWVKCCALGGGERTEEEQIQHLTLFNNFIIAPKTHLVSG